MFEKQSDREREAERKRSSIHWSSFQGLPLWVAGTQVLRPSLIVSKHTGRKLDRKVEVGVKPEALPHGMQMSEEVT